MATKSGVPNPGDGNRAARPYLAPTEVIPQTDGPIAGDRPARCPECRAFFPRSELTRHLLTAHGYVDVFGVYLPLPAAMTSLWDRVFTRGDAQAHERLCAVLTAQPGDPPPYLVALEAELVRRSDTLFASRWQELPRLIRCLRQSAAARPHFALLLRSRNGRVRDVGRELLLAEAGDELTQTEEPSKVRAWLNRLSPGDDVWEKIRLCQRLSRLGVSEGTLNECLRQLRAERPVACPECGAPIPQGQVESHLRQVHRIYQFRGKKGSLEETLAALLTTVCSPGADAATWEIFEELARDEYGPKADPFLADRLGKALEAQPQDRFEPALLALADLLAARERGPALAGSFAAVPVAAAHQLALVLAVRLPAPLPETVIAALRPLLTDKRVPREIRMAGAAALLQSTGTAGPAARKVLKALCRRTGKARAVECLRQLEGYVGKSPAIDELCARLEEKIRMSCPRCRAELRRSDMARHVWTEHGLMLYGRRVRRPWRVVEELIREYRTQRNVELLDRCRALGQFLDPLGGLRRVYRRLLAKQIDDVTAHHTLVAEARQEHRSLCPHCYALVPVPEDSRPQPLNESRGRLWAAGYVASVSENGLVPRLEMSMPGTVLYQGREPDRWWTKRAALVFLAGPPVLAALGLALALPYFDIHPLARVVRVLGVALVAVLAIHVWWRFRSAAADRAVAHAWTWMVPRLHESGYSETDSAFLASLALTSTQRGRSRQRAEQLARALRYTEKAVAARAAPVSHLAALWRLAIEDAAESGRDPVPLVAEQVGRCFEAKLPLAYAQQLLGQWESAWWTGTNLTRLRVLVCDRAFEAGLEVRELLDAGKAAPALGDVLGLDERESLARLRLLWSLRPRRPWDRWSDAETAFELAAGRGGAELLDRYPDLLLADRQAPPVMLCGDGLIFQDQLFTAPPRVLEVKTRRDFESMQYELVVGDLRLRFVTDPGQLLNRLERWFRYHFEGFLPQAPDVINWKGPGQTKKMQAQEAVRCPECRRLLLPRAGGVGGRLPEDPSSAAPRTEKRRGRRRHDGGKRQRPRPSGLEE